MVRGTGRGGEGRLEPRRVKEEHELYVCPIRRHCVRPAENVFSAFSGSFLVEERNVGLARQPDSAWMQIAMSGGGGARQCAFVGPRQCALEIWVIDF